MRHSAFLSYPIPYLLCLALALLGVLATTESAAGLEPDFFTYEIAPDVPQNEVDTIKAGFDIGRAFLDSTLGGDIPAAIRSQIIVKIVATGRGNGDPGGGGACCTAFSQSPPGVARIRPFFDVNHVYWTNQPTQLWGVITEHQKKVVHEYAHGWQSSLGCTTLFSQPLGFWLNEGIAEYVAYETFIARGSMQRSHVAQFQLQSAISAGELSRPLSDFGGPTADMWPGHVGYLAVDLLARHARRGIGSVRAICEFVAAGLSVPDAFTTAFDVSLPDFYAAFEVWRLDRTAPFIWPTKVEDQARADINAFATSRAFGEEVPGWFKSIPNWGNVWNLYWDLFTRPGGGYVVVYQITYTADPRFRFLSTYDFTSFSPWTAAP